MQNGERLLKLDTLIPVTELGGIRIRGVLAADLPHLFEIATSFQTYFLWDDGSIELMEERFSDLLRRKAETHTFFVIQEAKKEYGKPLGLAYIYSRDQVNGWAYYTVAADPSVIKKKGIGFSASVAVVDFAFFTWSLRKMYVEIQTNNKLALNTVREIGFIREGTLKEHRCVAGMLLDVDVLSMTRKQWYGASREAALDRLRRYQIISERRR